MLGNSKNYKVQLNFQHLNVDPSFKFVFTFLQILFFSPTT
jgi:hypothetical protein